MSLSGRYKVGDVFLWEPEDRYLTFRGYAVNGFFASDKLGQRFINCEHSFVVSQQAPSSGVCLMECRRCGVEIVEDW